jgi:predicted nuclease with TOPRIM domain
MPDEIEIELLQDRVDSLNVANEELRERLTKATNELVSLHERYQQIESVNRELSVQIGRLRLHLQQGIEL